MSALDILAAPGPTSRSLRSGTAPPLAWRLIHDEAHPGARNMAVDHALAACRSGADGVLRLYRWTRPTLSLGRNEPAGLYPIEVLRARGMDVVRRPTGGRAVLHDAELTYAVVAPIAGWGARAAYRSINEALAAALRSLGAPVTVSDGVVRALGPGAGPCFRAPAPGEVVAHGRKLVGSAQARIGGALLQHGSIMLGGSQRPLAGEDAPAFGGAPEAGGAVTLAELVPDVGIDEVAAAVAQSLERSLGGTWADGGLRPAEEEAALRLEADRYAQNAWTWRR